MILKDYKEIGLFVNKFNSFIEILYKTQFDIYDYFGIHKIKPLNIIPIPEILVDNIYYLLHKNDYLNKYCLIFLFIESLNVTGSNASRLQNYKDQLFLILKDSIYNSDYNLEKLCHTLQIMIILKNYAKFTQDVKYIDQKFKNIFLNQELKLDLKFKNPVLESFASQKDFILALIDYNKMYIQKHSTKYKEKSVKMLYMNFVDEEDLNLLNANYNIKYINSDKLINSECLFSNQLDISHYEESPYSYEYLNEFLRYINLSKSNSAIIRPPNDKIKKKSSINEIPKLTHIVSINNINMNTREIQVGLGLIQPTNWEYYNVNNKVMIEDSFQNEFIPSKNYLTNRRRRIPSLILNNLDKKRVKFSLTNSDAERQYRNINVEHSGIKHTDSKYDSRFLSESEIHDILGSHPEKRSYGYNRAKSGEYMATYSIASVISEMSKKEYFYEYANCFKIKSTRNEIFSIIDTKESKTSTSRTEADSRLSSPRKPVFKPQSYTPSIPAVVQSHSKLFYMYIIEGIDYYKKDKAVMCVKSLKEKELYSQFKKNSEQFTVAPQNNNKISYIQNDNIKFNFKFILQCYINNCYYDYF